MNNEKAQTIDKLVQPVQEKLEKAIEIINNIPKLKDISEDNHARFMEILKYVMRLINKEERHWKHPKLRELRKKAIEKIADEIK